MIQYEYLREALKNGLKVEQDLGANPFKYGMAGGTDTHNGLVAARRGQLLRQISVRRTERRTAGTKTP